MNQPQIPRSRLVALAAGRTLAGVVIIAAMLFVPAGTTRYWEGWTYLAVLLGPIPVLGAVMLARDPALFERRLRMDEGAPQQRAAIAALTVVILAILLVPGFDHRFDWSAVPWWLVLLADVGILFAYLLFALTIRENRYASRVIEVQQAQPVISSGPYAVVRHPMYLAMTIMFLLSPLALGSYWGVLPALFFPLALVPRIVDEERTLRAQLPGYAEYVGKVRSRLIPGVW